MCLKFEARRELLQKNDCKDCSGQERSWWREKKKRSPDGGSRRTKGKRELRCRGCLTSTGFAQAPGQGRLSMLMPAQETIDKVQQDRSGASSQQCGAA